MSQVGKSAMPPETVDTSRSEMLAINERQKAYYEGVRESGSHDYSGGSIATKAWSYVRSRLYAFQFEVGDRDRAIAFHREHVGDISHSRVLDLGVGGGSGLSTWLAEHSGEYVGIDLAEHPVRELSEKFAAAGYTNARAEAMDFLDNPFPDDHFDVVYASAVVHHFKDIDTVLAELLRVLKPGGIVLTYDPLQTEPINRLARTVYRRWQVDRDWEWPFTRATLEKIQADFDIVAVQGLLGLSRFGIPFYFIPGLQPVGRAIARRGIAYDEKHASRIGPALYQCWHVVMVLQKPK